MLFTYGPSTRGLNQGQIAALRRAAIYEVNLEKYAGKRIIEVKIDVDNNTIKLVVVVAKEEDLCYSNGSEDFTVSNPSSSSILCNRIVTLLRRNVLSRSFILIILVELAVFHWRERLRSRI